MRPKFDNKEEYLIAYYRQYRESGDVSGVLQDVVLALVAGGLFGLGLFRDDVLWTAIGFGIVAYRMLRGVVSGIRYNRTLARIIEKYEAALATAPDRGEPNPKIRDLTECGCGQSTDCAHRAIHP